jgi:hypothetical protein
VTTLISRARAMLRHLLRRASLEREMDDEFHSHLALRADDLERRGLSRPAAERAAKVEFGAMEAQKDAARDARGLRIWDELRANVGFAIRGIGHHPIQSLIVVVTLTLGVGISGVVFSVMNAQAFRAHVDRDAATFVSVFAAFKTDTTTSSFAGPVPLADYLAYARTMRTLSPITGWQRIQVSLAAGARPTPGAFVACTFFAVYGPVRPIAGRMLQRDDCDSRAPVAVISADLWRGTFGADSGAVGRVLRINGQTIRVVGVAPTFSSASPDDQIWLPYTLRGRLQLGSDDPSSPKAMRLLVDGRLAPGVSRADVLAEARVIAAHQDQSTPGRHTTLFVTDGSLAMQPGNGLAVATTVGVVFVALGCLALVACASVVSILLAIAHGRRTEMALRMALGAGAPRLAALLATESLMLASIAGATACALTFRLPRILLEWIIQRPVNFSLRPDWHVFTFLFVTTALAALAAANAPIRAVLSLDLNSTLRRVPDEARGKSRRDRGRHGAPRRDDRAHAAAGTHLQFAAALRRTTRAGDEPARTAAGRRMAPASRWPRARARGGGRRSRRDVRDRRAGGRCRDRPGVRHVGGARRRKTYAAVDRGIAELLRCLRHSRRARARVHRGRRRLRGRGVSRDRVARDGARAMETGRPARTAAYYRRDTRARRGGHRGRRAERDRGSGAGIDGLHLVAARHAAVSTVLACR